MAYCTHCGQPLLGQAKFCAGCGAKVLAEQVRTYATGYKEKMYKGVEQQLKSSLRKYAESALRKNISQLAQKGVSAVLESPSAVQQPTAVPEPPPITKQPVASEARGGVTIWTWLYLIVNLILAFRGYLSSEVMAIILCSAVVLLSVFFRRKKPKPYNWATKLLIVVQMVLVASILYRHVMGQFFTLTSLLFAALMYIDFSLLFKGNKQKS